MKKFREIFITVIFLLLIAAMAHGETWTESVRLSDGGMDPAIAVDGSNIYVVWEDYTPGNSVLYFKKSEDGGATWTKARRLKNTAHDFIGPAIAVNGSIIYVVWEDKVLDSNPEIYFKKSDDGGITWTKSKNLSNNVGYSGCPYYGCSAITVDGSNIYVVWQDHTPGNWEIYFKKSEDGGATWTKARRLTNNVYDSTYPAIAANGSNIYVVWKDYSPSFHNNGIYFKKSDDGGITWTKSKNLSNIAESYCDAEWPVIAVYDSNIIVLWQDNVLSNWEIRFKMSDDGGVSWSHNKRLTNTPGYSYCPAVAMDGYNIYVVWYEIFLRNRPDEIYFKKSEDGGATWTTENLSVGSYPAIAVNGSNIYVVYSGIYFKKGILD